jgi:hypothetical protein
MAAPWLVRADLLVDTLTVTRSSPDGVNERVTTSF